MPLLLLHTSLLTLFVNHKFVLCVAETDMSSRALRLVHLLLYLTSTAPSQRLLHLSAVLRYLPTTRCSLAQHIVSGSNLLHRFPGANGIDRCMAEGDYW